jgi:hypothetical protein
VYDVRYYKIVRLAIGNGLARGAARRAWSAHTCLMSEHHLEPPLEMDSLPAQPSATGKSPASHKLSRRDYAVGICLLLLVVFLWTTSNFVTEVRLRSHRRSVQCTSRMIAPRTCTTGDTVNLSCLCRPILDARRGSLTVAPCSITYLTTSTFSLYLLPFLIKSYIRRRRGGPDPRGGLG